jgi:putative SOS response-associated peptidase YedK
MCYYMGFKVSRNMFIRLKQIERDFGVDEALGYLRGIVNGFSNPMWPILKKKGLDDLEIAMMRWEFIPNYVTSLRLLEHYKKGTDPLTGERKRDPKTGKVTPPPIPTLNATSEKLLESNLWKKSAREYRCLAPVTHFFEWRDITPEGRKTKVRQPYFIREKMEGRQEVFFVASIYQPWTDKETGTQLENFVLVTTEANGVMRQIHNTKNRMPTILTEDLAYEWLFGDLSDERIMEIASYKIPSTMMEAYTVHPEVLKALDPTEAVPNPNVPELVICD